VQSLVLEDELIGDWGLSQNEVDYINRQQGFACLHCGNNLRANVLAKGLGSELGNFNSLDEIAHSGKFDHIKILEINECHKLTKHLDKFPNHILIEFPEYDIHNLKLEDKEWDFVIHSDTLEHLEDPLKALRECHRILKPTGKLLFTTPIIVDRISRNRKGLSTSYHGDYKKHDPGMLVHTEFGVDIWTMIAEAGFTQIKFTFLNFPAGIAITAWK
jgi:SAM-dependent methyltransferase